MNPLCDFDDDDYPFLEDFSDLPTYDSSCPNCGEGYDEIDFEYQICHLCHFNNNKEEQK